MKIEDHLFFVKLLMKRRKIFKKPGSFDRMARPKFSITCLTRYQTQPSTGARAGLACLLDGMADDGDFDF
jgi:hypothetical protein